MPAEKRQTMKYGYETSTLRSAGLSFRRRAKNEIAASGMVSRSLNFCAAMNRNSVAGSQR